MDSEDAATVRYVGELERIGPQGRDIMVLGVEAPGFEELSPQQRRFAYYMYRAALPGNKIAYHQSHRDAFEIKTVLEEIFLHSEGLDADLADAIQEYLKYVWIHHGQYDHYTHTKYTPHKLTRAGLKTACDIARANGAAIPANENETIEEMLSRLDRSMFDASFEPIQTNQSEGEDIVATSAVNYWDAGVTAADLESVGEEWRNRLNVRFAKRNGQIEPEVYRIGAVFSEELEATRHFLRLALAEVDSEEQRQSIETLIEFYETGDEATFREHMVHWLKSDSDIDFLNGFVEVYLDPRGIIGQFEANVSFKAGGGLIDKISENALYFEQRMPWPDEFKRDEVGRPVANVVNVLVETGDAGPVSPAAYNLPNYNDIRRDHGSKNVILHNVENTWSMELMEQNVNEFFLPEHRDNMIKYFRTLIRPLEVYMHEIIGHGSGQPAAGLTGDPRTLLGRAYSSLEECRADLVALYHIADPKLVEIGAFSLAEQRDVVGTAYVAYLQGWMSRMDRVPGLEVREAHNKGHHTIFSYLMENGGVDGKDFGVELIQEKGDYFVRVNDLELMRNGIGELLCRIQVIKSNGDLAGAEALFDRFGTTIKREWKDNVVERRKKLSSPKMKAFVFPHLKPVMEDGQLVDAELVYDEDLTAQQLRFSRLALSTDLNAD